MAELADEEISTKKPEAMEKPGKKFQDIGWWTDNKGYKHYGPIPQTREERAGQTRINSKDEWLYPDQKSDYWQDSPNYRHFEPNEWSEWLEKNGTK
jgi:hypothetical protein